MLTFLLRTLPVLFVVVLALLAAAAFVGRVWPGPGVLWYTSSAGDVYHDLARGWMLRAPSSVGQRSVPSPDGRLELRVVLLQEPQRTVSFVLAQPLAPAGPDAPRLEMPADRAPSLPQWSPDGTQAVLSARPTAEADEQLYLLAVPAMTLQALTQPPAPRLHPRWSPDGTRLVFQQWDGAQWDLAVMRLADGAISLLTRTPDSETAPVWSPDGTQIAYVASSRAGSAIYSIGAGGGTRALLADGPGNDTSPAWSPDGRYLAFVSTRGGTAHVFVQALSDGEAVQVSNEDWATQPMWWR